MLIDHLYVHVASSTQQAKTWISKVRTHYVQPNISSDLTFFAADFKEMLKIGSLITLFQVELNCLNNFTYVKVDICTYPITFTLYT